MLRLIDGKCYAIPDQGIYGDVTAYKIEKRVNKYEIAKTQLPAAKILTAQKITSINLENFDYSPLTRNNIIGRIVFSSVSDAIGLVLDISQDKDDYDYLTRTLVLGGSFSKAGDISALYSNIIRPAPKGFLYKLVVGRYWRQDNV